MRGATRYIGIRAAQWTNYRWSAVYSKCTFVLDVFIPRASSRPLEMSLPRTSWVKLIHRRTGVGRFYSFMYKWGLAPLSNCECGATDQTADHIISMCPIDRASRRVAGLTVLDDSILNTTTASIWSHRFFWIPLHTKKNIGREGPACSQNILRKPQKVHKKNNFENFDFFKDNLSSTKETLGDANCKLQLVQTITADDKQKCK